MLLSRIFTHSTQPFYSRISLYGLRNYKGKDKSSSNLDDLQQMQKQYAKEYFDQYRREVENNTVVRDFRRQIFQKNKQPVNQQQLNNKLNAQQRQLQKMLDGGSKEKVNKFSKKIMQHIANKRDMFKGKQSKSVFKQYADYSAYKTNNVSIQDRNYLNMDNLQRNNQLANTYKFIDNLPNNYAQKKQARQNIAEAFPDQANMSISQYGQRLQHQQNHIQKMNELQEQFNQINQFKMKMKPEEDDIIMDDNAPEQWEKSQGFLQGTLSTEVINKIYDLYIQGWSVREISRRFGILPARAKFHIWARARVYDQFVPKIGAKFVFYMYEREKQLMENNTVVDYGLDLDKMRNTDRYEQITVWNHDRVDAQRTPDQYTKALQKLQSAKKFGKYDMIQVGTHGKQNKRHLLKEWRIYRGKNSDDYFLKNKIFNGLMFENRKTRSIYY